MLVGIDPFNDEDPMAIYQKILKGKIKFPTKFDPSAKSLIKHLLVPDISKRYGCMKGGADDIKRHKFFKDVEFPVSTKGKPVVPKPVISSNVDIKNFPEFPNSDMNTPQINLSEDPFRDWTKKKTN